MTEYGVSVSVPYVQRDASLHRAIRLSMSKDHAKRIEVILDLIAASVEYGMTWHELSEITGLHHGQISGILSKLHQEQKIFALKIMRNRSHPYIHVRWKDKFIDRERVDEPAMTKAKQNRELIERCRAFALMMKANDPSSPEYRFAQMMLISALTDEN